MKSIISRVLTHAAFYAWYGTFIYRFLHPDSLLVPYMENYGLLMKGFLWVLSGILLLFLGVFYFLKEHFLEAFSGAEVVTPMREWARNLKFGVAYYASRTLGWGVILFVGVTGIDWWAFSVMLLSTLLSQGLVYLMKSYAEQLNKRNA